MFQIVTKGGGVVFAGEQEMKIFKTVFRDYGGKNVRETVFSIPDGAGNYWK